MEEINRGKTKRFCEVMNVLNYKPAQMAERLGISVSGVYSIASGERRVTDKHIKLLESQCHVNPAYMQNGEMPILLESNGEYVARVIQQYDLIPEARLAIEAIAELTTDEQRVLLSALGKIMMKAQARPEVDECALHEAIMNEPYNAEQAAYE